MGAVVAAAAAQRARVTRELVEHLRQERAFSAQTATPLRPQRRIGQRTLEQLVRDGVVVKAGDNYWLDEGAYTAFRARRRRTLMIIFPIMLAATAAQIGAAVIMNNR